jgi:Radical SAM superfamily
LDRPVTPLVTEAEPFFLGLNRRAMISLGPLTANTFCTYKCRFCYVHGPYPRYAGRSVDEIMDWLVAHRDRYDIVYLSGDTDSFAKPRTGEAIELLARMVGLDVSVLFTTRYVFSRPEREDIRLLLKRYDANGQLLVPCISVCQLHRPELEPRPIPPPTARLEQLRWLHDEGAKVLLTIRPFVPYVRPDEYAEIAYRGGPHSAAILGGDWYVDPAGYIDLQVRRALGIPDHRKLDPNSARQGPLDSTNDGQEWLTYRHPDAETAVQTVAAEMGKKFFMRSSPAIDFLRENNEHSR